MAGLTTTLGEELDGAVSGGSPERRVQMLQKVTGLFLSEAARLNEQQIDVFDDVLLRLMEHAEVQTLAQFSASISDSQAAPKTVIRQLAYHEDGSVAAPALSKSDRLSDSDLFDIAAKRGHQHLRAISGRKTLDKAVTDILLKSGDAGVSHALAKNAGARFSDFGYRTLVQRSDRDERLAQQIGVRPDLPVKMLQDLLSNASEAVRARLLESAAPETRKKIQASLERIAAQSSVQEPEPADYATAEAAVLALNRAGKLNVQTINRFAVRGEHTHVVAALALISSVPIETIKSLVYRGAPDGLIVACRAAKLDWTTAAAIVQHRPNCPDVSKQELADGKKVFEMIAVSTAQQTLHIWSTRPAKKRA
jgi:uncharacterized protein (DUF2336 family)